MFTSTRSNLKVTSSEAIIYGIAKDKGLLRLVKLNLLINIQNILIKILLN